MYFLLLNVIYRVICTHAPNCNFKSVHISQPIIAKKKKKYLKCTLTDQFKNEL